MLKQLNEDTIVAPATPPGQGGVAIIRLSGTRALDILNALVPTRQGFSDHLMVYGHVMTQGEPLDECMAVWMKAPRSYTREDVAEIHLHGGEAAVRATLEAACALGARMAEAGEFTRRAFQNGRVDLSRAEAVMAMISATGERERRAAMRTLSGVANGFVSGARAALLAMLSGVEAALDYPDEVDETETAAQLQESARVLAQRLRDNCDERGAHVLTEGLQAAIIGAPNAGKSSLLNALCGAEAAIVTDIPGTTRDVVRGSFMLDGLTIHLMDTAGIRDSEEPIEAIGVARAKQAAEQADVTLLAIDASKPLDESARMLLQAPYALRIVLLTKCDLPVCVAKEEWPRGALHVSAKSGEGLDTLKAALREAAGSPCAGALTQTRHMALAREAARSLDAAADTLALGAPVDLAAIDLHEALNALGRITGENADEDLLDEIFSRFCVGK